jgi:hypothetical protein
LEEKDVPFAPNGVTYASSAADASGTIVVTYSSVRVLKLGTMTSLPSELGVFEPWSTAGPLTNSLLEFARQFDAEAKTAQIWADDSTGAPVPDTVVVTRNPSASSFAYLSRQSSVTNGSVAPAGSTSASAVGGSPSHYRTSFLGRGSVTPLDVEDPPNGSVTSPQAPYASPGGSVGGSIGGSSAISTSIHIDAPEKPALSVASSHQFGWSMRDVRALRHHVRDVGACPAPLWALHALHSTEDRLLHPGAERAALTSEEVLARLVSAPGALESAESSASLHSASVHSRQSNTVNITAGRPSGDRVSARNPVAQFCKSISKGLQHAFDPLEVVDARASRRDRGADRDSAAAPSGMPADTTVSDGPPDSGSVDTATVNQANGAAGSKINSEGKGESQFMQQVYPSPAPKVPSAAMNRHAPSRLSNAGKGKATAKASGMKVIGVAGNQLLLLVHVTRLMNCCFLPGMNNLGNICYMSSALQCLMRTPLLVQYFQTLQFRFDLNPKSPLGSKGKVTEEFAK